MQDDFITYDKEFNSVGTDKASRLDILTYKIFEETSDGKEFLEELIRALWEERAIPASKQKIESYGSLEAYLGYKEGLKGLIHMIKASISTTKARSKGVSNEY